MLPEVLAAYFERFPDDRPELKLLSDQIGRGETMNDRHNFTGHITGAAIVLSPSLDKLLLVHHAIYDRWLQPGGHWEPDEADPLLAARREAEEETGVQIARYLPLDVVRPLVPLEITTHYIPANDRKMEPEHYHHDFRYVFVSADETLQRDEVETHDAGWFALDAPQTVDVRIVVQRLRELLLPAEL